ncbi:MAG: alpha/beta fold hydrolase [Actinomycetota bacterium]
MNTVTSKDGTTIAYDRAGNGPAVILVCGGSVDRTSNAPLAEILSARFTTFNYDRRGRGDSGDAQPYSEDREIEDIEAVLGDAGGTAFLYGTSSGAALALDATAVVPGIAKLALWEPPYITSEFERFRPPLDTADTYRELVAEGRRGDAAEFFMSKVVGMPDESVAQAKQSPWWPAQEALAHTLAYDAEIMGDYSVPTELAATVATPTVVIDGGASFPFLHAAADTLAEALPNGERRTLEGQEHNVDPAAIAAVLEEFFAA